MSRGGFRKGAGRPKGAKDRQPRRSWRALAAATEAVSALPGGFKGDAHSLLMMIYKDPMQPMNLRLDAAKGAAPYEKPRLAQVETTSHVFNYVVAAEPIMDESEWAREFFDGKVEEE